MNDGTKNRKVFSISAINCFAQIYFRSINTFCLTLIMTITGSCKLKPLSRHVAVRLPFHACPRCLFVLYVKLEPQTVCIDMGLLGYKVLASNDHHPQPVILVCGRRAGSHQKLQRHTLCRWYVRLLTSQVQKRRFEISIRPLLRSNYFNCTASSLMNTVRLRSSGMRLDKLSFCF